MPPPKSVEINGRTQTLSEWAREIGVKPQVISRRYVYGHRGEDLLRPLQVHKKPERLPWWTMAKRCDPHWLDDDDDGYSECVVEYAKLVGGLNVHEIACVTGMSAGRVDQVLRTALWKIRQAYGTDPAVRAWVDALQDIAAGNYDADGAKMDDMSGL